MPICAAVQTLRAVNAMHPAALRALPALILAFKKTGQPHGADIFKVFDHAHTVFCAVAQIQFPKTKTGEFGALKTVFLFERGGNLIAVFDETQHAVRRLVDILAFAAQAWFPLAQVRYAGAAVHPARRDQDRIKNNGISVLFWGHGQCLHQEQSEIARKTDSSKITLLFYDSHHPKNGHIPAEEFPIG
jgi:hypothetical protein